MGALRPKLGHTLADTKIQSVKDVCALFGRKESNSARRANTARLRARAKEGYSESGCTQGFALPKIVIAARATGGRPYFFFPLRIIFPARRATKHDEARPVIAAKTNMTFLIERNSSVQLGGFLRAQALKSLFFGSQL